MSLGYQEQNDNKAIILTDTSNYDYTITPNLEGPPGGSDALVTDTLYEIVENAGNTAYFIGLGAANGLNGERFISTSGASLAATMEVKQVTPKVTEITAITLDTTVTGVSNVAQPKDQVDLYVLNSGPFTDVSQLVFTITAALLGDTADSLLEDGLYALEYNVSYQGSDQIGTKELTQLLEVTILVYGQVKVAVYDKYRQIPAWCNCEDQDALWKIMETDLLGAYLTAIETSAYIAKTEELINMLIVLDDMVKNGSKLYY
jgi:hypothetical protein